MRVQQSIVQFLFLQFQLALNLLAEEGLLNVFIPANYISTSEEMATKSKTL